jgi:alkanesulfonate monooxygenase SsuD/methylene tetrahydromethanopterin reductase-like flavin-dependent oxidoreductase (luciferase family)
MKVMEKLEFLTNHRLRLHYECVILFTLLAVLAFYKFYIPAKEHKTKALKVEAEMENDVTALKKKVNAVEEKCEAFIAGEPETVERMIRSEFGWGRQDEVLVVLPEE